MGLMQSILALKKMKQLMADVTGSDDKGVGVGDG